MKKIFLIVVIIAICNNIFAQDLLVESAKTALSTNNYDEAKADIDKAMTNPKTMEKPKALYIKAKIYYQIQTDKVPKYIESNPYREAGNALIHLTEVDAKYQKDDVDMMLFNIAIMYNNDGVKAYTKNRAEQIACMQSVTKIHDLNGGKRYEKSAIEKYKGKFDTLSANATLAIAISYFIDTNYAESIKYLLIAKNNKITQTLQTYNMLIQAYDKLNKNSEELDMIKEARTMYPKDKTLLNQDINASKKAGKLDETIKKIEDAANNDKENPELQYYIAIIYLQIYTTADSTKFGGSKVLSDKIAAALNNALEKAPNDANYNFNYGVLYYEKGRNANEYLNTIADKMYEKTNKNQKEDQKKYDAVKTERDGYFTKSLDYLEKVYNMYNSKTNLNEDDKSIFKNDVTALRDAYNILGKNDKYKEMKDKLLLMD